MNNNKTQKVAVYPNGKRFVIRKVSNGYKWSHDAVSSHMSAVIENVEAEGGTVITEINPDYREPKITSWLGI